MSSREKEIEMESPKTVALLVAAKKAAEMLAVSPRKLWSLTASGDISHVRIGRCVRYAIKLARWIFRRLDWVCVTQ